MDDNLGSEGVERLNIYLIRIVYMETYEILEKKMDAILLDLKDIKEGSVEKVYDTKSLCEYLKVGKSVIEKLRQDGELSYAKVGRTIIFTQKDVENLIRNNHVSYVS